MVQNGESGIADEVAETDVAIEVVQAAMAETKTRTKTTTNLCELGDTTLSALANCPLSLFYPVVSTH